MPLIDTTTLLRVADRAAYQYGQIKSTLAAIRAVGLGYYWTTVTATEDADVEIPLQAPYYGVDNDLQVIPAVRGGTSLPDIVFAMENHFKDGYWQYREFAQKKEVFLQIVNAIDEQKYFGVQYDPSNALVAGDDPIEVLQAVKHRVKTMHASDRYLEPGFKIEDMRQADGTFGYPKGLTHGVTGRGSNDYDEIFQILKSVNYQGWICIEDGMNGMDEMKESIDFLKRMRAKYFGK